MPLEALAGLATTAPAAVRRPAFAVSFGGAAGAGGGGPLGGLTAAVGGAVGAAAGGGSDPWTDNVVSITIMCALAPAVNAADLVLSDRADAPTVALGDAGAISLGYGDDPPQAVITGRIAGVRRSIHGVTRLAAADAGSALARLRVIASYEQQNAGAVVNDLAGRASVTTGVIEPGIDLPFLALDDACSAWAHIAALARRCGFLAFVAPDGSLTFAAPAAGEPSQRFSYGADILALETNDAEQSAGAITTTGDGAAGSQGSDAWSWLIKDSSAVQGTAGTGAPDRLVRDAALRSTSAAQTAADGIAAAHSRCSLTGSMLVPGAPAITVGSTIEIADAPTSSLNGRFLVRAVKHRYVKRAGFTTRVYFAATGSGGAAAGGGLLGAAGGLL